MTDVFRFLDELHIRYTRFDHPAVFTTEQAEIHVPKGHGFDTKNLFLRNKKADRHILVVVGGSHEVDLQSLAGMIGCGRLSFASPERLQKYLGLSPGSVTLLGLLNDPSHRVEVWIDQCAWQAPALQCHPLINTSTLVIDHAGIEAFLAATGHKPTIAAIPARVRIDEPK